MKLKQLSKTSTRFSQVHNHEGQNIIEKVKELNDEKQRKSDAVNLKQDTKNKQRESFYQCKSVSAQESKSILMKECPSCEEYPSRHSILKLV